MSFTAMPVDASKLTRYANPAKPTMAIAKPTGIRRNMSPISMQIPRRPAVVGLI
jgi:hypothetical protein